MPLMKAGKLATSAACSSPMLPELSITNRKSTLPHSDSSGGASGRLKSKITGGPSSLAAEVESADPVEVPGLGAMVVPASPVVDGGGPVVVARFGSVEVEPGSSSPEV